MRRLVLHRLGSLGRSYSPGGLSVFPVGFSAAFSITNSLYRHRGGFSRLSPLPPLRRVLIDVRLLVALPRFVPPPAAKHRRDSSPFFSLLLLFSSSSLFLGKRRFALGDAPPTCSRDTRFFSPELESIGPSTDASDVDLFVSRKPRTLHPLSHSSFCCS